MDDATQQAPTQVTQGLGDQPHLFLLPLLLPFDRLIDVRLVRTFAETVQVLLKVRNQTQGLLLSELAAICSLPTRPIRHEASQQPVALLQMGLLAHRAVLVATSRAGT